MLPELVNGVCVVRCLCYRCMNMDCNNALCDGACDGSVSCHSESCGDFIGADGSPGEGVRQ